MKKWWIFFLFFSLIQSCTTRTGKEVQPDDSVIAKKSTKSEFELFGFRKWSIRCYYFDNSKPGYWGISSKKLASNWTYNTLKMGSKTFRPSGVYQDGFFVMDREQSKFPIPFSDLSDLNELCEDTLLDNQKILSVMAVKPSFLPPKRLVPIVLESHESHLTRVVVFGDSLSDTGNLKRKVKIMPQFPYFFGRFSGKWAWVDQVQKLGLLSVLNFSYGGATTGKPGHAKEQKKKNGIVAGGKTAYAERAINLRNIATGDGKKFVDEYGSIVGGRISSPEQTLGIVWLGVNDYVAASRSIYGYEFKHFKTGKGGYADVVGQTIDNILDVVQKLRSYGMENILIFNLPNQLTGYLNNERSIARAVKVLGLHNKLLKEKIADLDDEKIQVFDVQDLFDRMWKNPAYKYTNIRTPQFKGDYQGFDHDFKIKKSFRTFFFDDVHPSSYTQFYLAIAVLKKFEDYENFSPAFEWNHSEQREYCLQVMDQ